MKIETSAGRTMDAAGVVSMTLRGKAQLMISLPEGTPLAEAAQALDGLEWIKAEGREAGVTTTYEGYNRIATMRRVEDGSLQVTLTREG